MQASYGAVLCTCAENNLCVVFAVGSCACVYVHVYACMHVYVPWCSRGGQRTIDCSLFISSIMWILGVEVNLLSLVATAFTH